MVFLAMPRHDFPAWIRKPCRLHTFLTLGEEETESKTTHLTRSTEGHPMRGERLDHYISTHFLYVDALKVFGSILSASVAH